MTGSRQAAKSQKDKEQEREEELLELMQE